MSEYTPPVYSKFYSSDRHLYVSKTPFLTMDRSKSSLKSLFLVVNGYRHAIEWIMKVIFGENIGWIAVNKDWAKDLKLIKVDSDEA